MKADTAVGQCCDIRRLPRCPARATSVPRSERKAGAVANIAGLGDATEPEAVGYAITAVYIFCCIPFALAALLMFRFVRITLGKPGAVSVAIAN